MDRETNSSQPFTQQIEHWIIRVDQLFTRLITPHQHDPDLLLDEIQQLLDTLMDLGRTHPAPLLGMIRLRTDLKYSVTRSMQNALFALWLADHLEWEPTRVRILCAAALTEQIGLYPLRPLLPPATSPTEQQARRAHYAEKSLQALATIGVKEQQWLSIIEQHATAKESSTTLLSDENALLLLIDRYGAMITAREGRQPLPTEHCFNALHSEREFSHLSALQRLLGDYPPGTAVKLQDGSQAIITQRDQDSATLEIATIITPEGRQYRSPQHQWLSAEQKTISHSLPFDWSCHLNPQLLWPDPASPAATGSRLFQFIPSLAV